MSTAANQIILEDIYVTQAVDDDELGFLLKQGDMLYAYYFKLLHFL